MFLGVDMFDLYITICDEIPEVMKLDRDVICARLHLRRNCECGCLLILFVNYDWIFENIAQYRRGVCLKVEYELNFRHKTKKGKKFLIT